MWNWDYDLPQNWQPTTPSEWEWFLVRKINYGDLQGLTKAVVKKYWPKIAKQLDPGKRAMFEHFLEPV